MPSTKRTLEQVAVFQSEVFDVLSVTSAGKFVRLLATVVLMSIGTADSQDEFHQEAAYGAEANVSRMAIRSGIFSVPIALWNACRIYMPICISGQECTLMDIARIPIPKAKSGLISQA